MLQKNSQAGAEGPIDEKLNKMNRLVLGAGRGFRQMIVPKVGKGVGAMKSRAGGRS